MVGNGTVLHEACGQIVPVAPGFCVLDGLTFSDAVINRDVCERQKDYEPFQFNDEDLTEGRMVECLVY